MAVPRPGGHVVLDMAVSQFSYGALAVYRERGEPLPVDGGFDAEGRLTRDAGTIIETQRLLPAGYWKGSGLAVLLDLIAAMVSGGLATFQIPRDPDRETRISQFFLAIDPRGLGLNGSGTALADGVIASLGVRYPGQRTLELREENLRLGIPVDERVWQRVEDVVR